MDFNDLASAYAEKNIVAIPIKKRSKLPAVNEWQNLTIETNKNIPGHYQIGLLMGKASGIICLDVDDESLIEKVKQVIPPILCGKIGKKGISVFFRYNGESTQHLSGIDIQSDKSYVVIPPSIHPDGMSYQWIGKSLLEVDLDDLPVLDVAAIKKIVGKLDIPLVKGRHNELMEIASAMIGRNCPENEIIEELLKKDSEYQTPYFTDKSEGHGGHGRLSAMNMVASILRTHLSNGSNYQPTSSMPIIDLSDPIEPEEPRPELPVPEGALKELAEYCLKTSHKPRPALALMSAVSALGVLASHKFKFGYSTPNLYQLMVVESAGGKDRPLKLGKEVFDLTGALKHAGLESYKSGAVLLSKTQNQKVRLDTIDEFTRIFHGMKGNAFKGDIPEILNSLYSSSLDFYFGDETVTYGSVGYCYCPHVSILGACTPTAFATHFPKSTLIEGIGGRFIMAYDREVVKQRMVKPVKMSEALSFFLTHLANIFVNVELVTRLNSGIKYKDGKVFVEKTEFEKPIITDVQISDSGLLDELMDYYSARADKCLDEDIRPIYNRSYEKAEKIALIHAISRMFTGKVNQIKPAPMIEKVDIEFARQYLDYMNQSQIDLMMDSFSVSSEVKLLNKTRKKMAEKFPGEFVTTSKIHRDVFSGSITAKKVEEILKSMYSDGMLECEKRGNKMFWKVK